MGYTDSPFVCPLGPFSGLGYSPRTDACVDKQQHVLKTKYDKTKMELTFNLKHTDTGLRVSY